MKILSVGNDIVLLTARHQILLSHGYEAEYALPAQAEVRIASGHFDLLILSATISNRDKERIRIAAANGTRVLDLTTIVWPAELLEMIQTAVHGYEGSGSGL